MSKPRTLITRAIDAINGVDTRLFIFLLLCLNLLSFVPGDNEETYFALAKQYMDPDWIPGSFTFTEWVGTRFLFQHIAGWALRYLTFEQLAFWGRMVNFLLYAFPLARIFRLLRIRNTGILLILQLYIANVNTQSFFGMEWIFGGFEGKTLAYVFVLWGFYFMLRGDESSIPGMCQEPDEVQGVRGRAGGSVQKYVTEPRVPKATQPFAGYDTWAACFAAAASYFHILVGGWFFVLVWIYGLVRERSLKRAIVTGLVYVALVAPFVIYLATYLTDSRTVIHGVDVDWVYSFFRNTHHTAPMHREGAMQKVLPRVVASFLLLLWCLFGLRRSKDEDVRRLNTIVRITLLMVFVGLAITYIDVHGRLLKYYLFRIAALGTFAAYLLVYVVARAWLVRRQVDTARLLPPVVAMVAIMALIHIEKNFARNIFPREDRALMELTDYVKAHTRPDDVFLFRDRDELSFPRRTRREALVIFKFDPGGGEKIYEWYTRECLRRRLRTDPAVLDTIADRYRLDYLITTSPMTHPRLKEVYRNPKFYLYGISTSK